MSARNWALLLFLSLLWGGSFLFYKVLVAVLPPLTLVLGRVAIAAIALNLGLILVGKPVPWSRKNLPRFALLGLLNNVVPFILICWGETRISSGLASILNATTPLFLAPLAHILMRDDRLSRAKIVAVMLGFCGVVVLVGPAAFSPGQEIGGELAVLAAAFIYALGAIYGKSFHDLPALHTATGQISAATMMMLPLALAIDRPWTLPVPDAPAIAALLAFALLSTALAYVLFYRLLAAAAATHIALVSFLMPVHALWLGAVFLHEPVTVPALAGMALIGVGLFASDGGLLRLVFRPAR